MAEEIDSSNSKHKKKKKTKSRRRYSLTKKKKTTKKNKNSSGEESSDELGEPTHSSQSLTDGSDEAEQQQHSGDAGAAGSSSSESKSKSSSSPKNVQTEGAERGSQEHNRQDKPAQPNVQYAVNEKGEFVQFSINQKGIPELWLQVDHSKCLVSPLTVNSNAYPHLNTSTGEIVMMSNSKKNLMMKTSLLSIVENDNLKNNTPRGLMGSSEVDGEDSDGAEERFLSQYKHLNVNDKVTVSPRPNATATAAVVEKTKATTKSSRNSSSGAKKKVKKKKRRNSGDRWDMSGDEEEQGAKTQGNSAVPSAKIPSLEQRISVKIPSSSKSNRNKKEKSSSRHKKDSSKSPKVVEERKKASTHNNKSSSGTGGRRKIRRSHSMPRQPPSPHANNTKNEKQPKEPPERGITRSISYKTYSHNNSDQKKMGVSELRDRFGSERSLLADDNEYYDTNGEPYVEMPAELQAYGLPAKVKRQKGRPSLEQKEYQMSKRSLRNLEPDSSDDEEDENLVKYLKTSYKMDLTRD